MATTTNYGWTTPDDTALVKDGASAIRALGTAIDTSMNTALGTKKSGLVLLNTTSFSGVSSQSINDVFSATYDNYKITIKSTGVTNNSETYIRFRVSGADNTTTSYQVFLARYTSGGFTAFDTALGNQGLVGRSDDTITTTNFDIYSPFLSERTTAFGLNFCDTQITWGGTQFTGTTSFTGFTLYPGSNNFTGTVSVYGYNK